jgi:hypothetical protein
MSTGTAREALDFDDAIPTCWKYQITSDCAKARAENTICRKHHTIREWLFQEEFVGKNPHLVLWQVKNIQREVRSLHPPDPTSLFSISISLDINFN